jgi:hypothetical protein
LVIVSRRNANAGFYGLPSGSGWALFYFALLFEPPVWLLAITPILMLTMVAARRLWIVFLTLGVVLCFALGFNAAQIETRVDFAPMLTEP